MFNITAVYLYMKLYLSLHLLQFAMNGYEPLWLISFMAASVTWCIMVSWLVLYCVRMQEWPRPWWA